MEIGECVTDEQSRAVWPVMRQLREGLTEEVFLDRFAAARKEGYRLFVATENGQPVGAIGWRLNNNLVFGPFLYVDDLVVDAAFRGRGVGRLLLDFARSEATLEGCAVLALTSGFQRTGAHAFYEREGMIRTGYTFNEVLSRR